MPNTKKIQSTVRIPEELWREFQKACIDRSIKQQKGFEEALSVWLAAPSPDALSTHWQRTLHAILTGPHSEIAKRLLAALRDT